MNYKIMKEETHKRVKNASDMIDFYNNPLKQGEDGYVVASNHYEFWLDLFDYYDTVEGMLNRFEHSLERWLSLLETDGIDSKNMVATDIQHILEEINK